MATAIHTRRYRVLAGVGAGAGAALAMLVAMGGLRLAFGLPTIPELMINPVVKLLGGEAFSTLLDNLYYLGRPLLFTVILEGTLLLGAVLGLLYAWLGRPNPATGRRLSIYNNAWGGILYGLLLGLLLNVIFLPIVEQPAFADRAYGIFSDTVIPLWAGLVLLALIYGVTVQGLLPPLPLPAPVLSVGDDMEPESASAVVVNSNLDRRGFLRIASGALLALVGGAAFTLGGFALNGGFNIAVTRPGTSNIGSTDASQDTPDDTPTPEVASRTNTGPPTPQPTAARPISEPTQVAQATDMPAPAAQVEPPPTAEAAPVEPSPTAVEVAQAPTSTPEPPPTGTPAPTPVPVVKVREITPTESFYHVSKNFFDPSPSADGWKLEIKGLVDKPYALTYKELTAMPAQVVTVGMMCISNPIGGGLAGNAKWKGVRLADLLKKARPKSGVVDVMMQAVDGYTDSIPIQKAMDPDVMLVWEMGGAPLNSTHGFPARLLVPGIYGMKHVKWITSFELVDYDFKGYWQQPDQGWSDPAPVNIMSRIDYPTDGTLDLKAQTVSGVAFAGDRSISKVEASTDGGQSWNEAYVKPPLSHTAWVVWAYNWTPTQPGKYVLKVRATDGKGNLQTPKRADPYPNGATGYHAVTYRVRGASAQAPNSGETPAADLGINQFGRRVVRERDPSDPTTR